MTIIQPKPFPTAQAHHDLPWVLADKFARHGVDVNDPAFGRWVSQLDHSLFHNQMVPTYNQFWREFWEQEDEVNPWTVQDILDKLAEARSIYKVNNGL